MLASISTGFPMVFLTLTLHPQPVIAAAVTAC